MKLDEMADAEHGTIERDDCPGLCSKISCCGMDNKSDVKMNSTDSPNGTKPRSGSLSEVPRYDETLSFVAGDTGTQMSAVDSDVYSWLLMNSDLFPSSNRNKTKNGNVAGDIGEDEDILNVLEKEMPKQDNQVSKVEVQRSNSLDGLL